MGPDPNGWLLPPRTIVGDKYLLGRVLGHGGFGITYLGWDLRLRRKLAVKEYFPHQFASRSAKDSTVVPYAGEHRQHFETGLRKFLAEGQALVKFQSHAGIVSGLDFIEANDTAYLAMEYVEGQTLKEYLDGQPGGRLPVQYGIAIMMQVMDALRAVHAEGFVHRDVSPDNIYITRDRQVKLLDFGSVKDALREHSHSIDVVIKRGYSPFEQYQKSGKIGSWTDVYAAAATLYHILTGQKPPDSAERMSHDTLQAPSALGIALPPTAEKVLLAALAVHPAKRLQTIEELQKPLLALSGASTTNEPAPPVSPEAAKPADSLTEPVHSIAKTPLVTEPVKTQHPARQQVQQPPPTVNQVPSIEPRRWSLAVAVLLVLILLTVGGQYLFRALQSADEVPVRWNLTVEISSGAYATLDRTRVPEGGQKLRRTHRFEDLDARTYELRVWQENGNSTQQLYEGSLTIRPDDPEEVTFYVQ